MNEPRKAINGKKLKALRIKAGLSQFGLAMATDLSISLIRKIEYGRRAGSNLNTVFKLMEFFNVTMEELL